jgi:hypothetical protein
MIFNHKNENQSDVLHYWVNQETGPVLDLTEPYATYNNVYFTFKKNVTAGASRTALIIYLNCSINMSFPTLKWINIRPRNLRNVW